MIKKVEKCLVTIPGKHTHTHTNKLYEHPTQKKESEKVSHRE